MQKSKSLENLEGKMKDMPTEGLVEVSSILLQAVIIKMFIDLNVPKSVGVRAIESLHESMLRMEAEDGLKTAWEPLKN